MASRFLLALVLAAALALVWRFGSRDRAPGTPSNPAMSPGARPGAGISVARPSTPAGTVLSPAEKAARVAQIRRDYDEIRAKTSADFAAAGTSYPGGLNAFLRQLALLEREKRRDFAAVLDPGELEDLEMKEIGRAHV